MDEPGDREYSRGPQLDDLVKVCRGLNDAGARYVLIGGFAVISYGLDRSTKDIDLLVDPSRENVALLKKGLAVLADNAAADLDDGDVAEYGVVRVADEVVVDLLARACDVTYYDAIQDAETVDIRGVAVPRASKTTLILTKRTIRPSDAADVNFLKAVLSGSRLP